MSGFKTKARTIELLGRKQIRDSVTALAELMKNAYDADAPLLRVEFSTKGENQHVVIADKGLGMSKMDIESKWLVLGTNSKTKKKNKTSPSGRPLMGAKGIGRLASATLGRQLWMFTKTKDSLWNIVFINWDIFENPYMSIEEVHVPTRFGISSNELLTRFDEIVNEMLFEQRSNFDHKAWNPESDTDNVLESLFERVNRDLSAPTVNRKNIEKYIAAFGSGTILYIDQLHDNWNQYISPISSEARGNDVMLEKMYNRFASFISTFKHTVTTNIPFVVEIYIDGEPWAEDYDFTADDYNYYDIKVDGCIERGIFTGKLFANNADQKLLDRCNSDLAAGISVTSGILNWEAIDCGTFRIKFCHLEGDRNRSGLSPDDYSRITRKLKTTCGICVYRDGVRVLPYGEPENDFLGIEERRSKKASRYIFSHRNIFGRIDIDTETNPLLEDKSSREGLIENAQYFYFVHTIQNLLTILAVDYLSSVRTDSLGIQQSYVERNRAIDEANRIKKNYEKQERIFANNLIKKANDWYSKIKDEVAIMNAMAMDFCTKSQEISLRLNVNDGYDALNAAVDKITLEKRSVIDKVESLESQKFDVPQHIESYFSDTLLLRINKQNRMILAECNRCMVLVEDAYNQASNTIAKLIDQWVCDLRELAQTDPQRIKSELLDRLASILTVNRDALEGICQNSLKSKDNLRIEMLPVLEFMDSFEDNHDLKNSAEWKAAEDIITQLSGTKVEIDNLFDNSPDAVVEKSNDIIAKLNKFNAELVTVTQRIHYNENSHLGDLARKSAILKTAIEDNVEYSNEDVIGALRQDNIRLQAEVDIYSDLANMGLAAEIVSHEFNQLFANVNNAIRNMTPYIKDPSAKYWLRQIDMGFRSISDRQNQLSPMYRSYSLKKAPVQLRTFIDEVGRFTEGEFKRNDVNFLNEVSPNVVLKISKSKIFPALSNLINNSLYWVLDQKKRIILVRYEEALRTLYVEDSGLGIAATNKEKIFEPFVSYKPNGRGLGLTIARKVLESQGHKLEIGAENEKMLSGACFKIIFSKDVVEDEK